MSNDKEDPLNISRPPVISELDEFPLEVKIFVSWREMDAFGIVSNIEYFRYFEDARIAYFWELGFQDPDLYRKEPNFFPNSKIGPILSSTSSNFKKPLIFPDILHVGARVNDIKKVRFHMEHKIFSEELDSIAAEGESTVVIYNYEKETPVPIPKRLREKIEEMEGKTFDKT